MTDHTPTQIMYAFVGDNGPGTEPTGDGWARHLFDSEAKARSFGGRWKGSVVKVEVRAVSAERVAGDIDFNRYPSTSQQ